MARLKIDDDTPMAEIDVLEIYENEYQNSLHADPLILNLQKESKYYFELGLKVCEKFEEEYHN